MIRNKSAQWMPNMARLSPHPGHGLVSRQKEQVSSDHQKFSMALQKRSKESFILFYLIYTWSQSKLITIYPHLIVSWKPNCFFLTHYLFFSLTKCDSGRNVELSTKKERRWLIFSQYNHLKTTCTFMLLKKNCVNVAISGEKILHQKIKNYYNCIIILVTSPSSWLQYGTELWRTVQHPCICGCIQAHLNTDAGPSHGIVQREN